jgi:hypothetical protein
MKCAGLRDRCLYKINTADRESAAGDVYLLRAKHLAGVFLYRLIVALGIRLHYSYAKSINNQIVCGQRRLHFHDVGMSSPDKEKKMFKNVLYTVLTVNYISFAGIAGITLSCAIFAQCVKFSGKKI